MSRPRPAYLVSRDKAIAWRSWTRHRFPPPPPPLRAAQNPPECSRCLIDAARLVSRAPSVRGKERTTSTIYTRACDYAFPFANTRTPGAISREDRQILRRRYARPFSTALSHQHTLRDCAPLTHARTHTCARAVSCVHTRETPLHHAWK